MQIRASVVRDGGADLISVHRSNCLASPEGGREGVWGMGARSDATEVVESPLAAAAGLAGPQTRSTCMGLQRNATGGEERGVGGGAGRVESGGGWSRSLPSPPGSRYCYSCTHNYPRIAKLLGLVRSWSLLREGTASFDARRMASSWYE